MAVWLRKQTTFSFVATFHTSCELQALKYFFQVLLIQEAWACYFCLACPRNYLFSENLFMDSNILGKGYAGP